MTDKFLKISAIYNFITSKTFRIFIYLTIIIVIVFSLYKNKHDSTSNADINLKYKIETKNLSNEEIKLYLENNGFKFYGGNPIKISNFSLLDDGVDFEREQLKDDNVKYYYCNSYITSICIDTNINVEDLPSHYSNTSTAYYEELLNIYNDYYDKLKELNLTQAQMNGVLDYYYESIK